MRGAAPAPVFDTQIAALLLGYPDQIGYGNLVRELLGIELDKLHTRADWSRRPLSQAELDYAANDVIYLVEVYRKVRDRLLALGRLDWLEEDFARLSDNALYRNPPEAAWLRVKGGNRLKGAALAVLQALTGWRESQAQRRDRPRGWILRDDALLEIARHRPQSLAELGHLRGVQEGFVRNQGEQVLALVAEAAGRQPLPCPDSGARLRLTPGQEALVDVMSALVRIGGKEHDLNPAMLATRRQLEALVAGHGDVEVLHGWRRKLVGARLQALLAGELSLSVRDGELAVEP